MAKLHFVDILNKDSIEGIARTLGFKDSLSVEQFIMDFEILYHIRKVLPDCVVKGGMAVPFHISDKKLHRLSVDIDIVTERSREDVTAAMRQVAAELEGIVKIPEPHKPNNPAKKLPLSTYYCGYKSTIADNPKIKIEIFYGNEMKIRSWDTDEKSTVNGVDVDFTFPIYDRGSLIGDKLTTLPFNTIGINKGREKEVPKQVYDIACLLRSISAEPPMGLIAEMFERVASDEISYFTSRRPTFDQVLDDLDRFSESLIILGDQYRLNQSYAGRFRTFKANMLGGRSYSDHAHATDVLLVSAIARLTIRKLRGAKLEDIITKAEEILDGLAALSQLKESDRKAKVKGMIGEDGQKEMRKVLKMMLPEQAFLHYQLAEIEAIG